MNHQSTRPCHKFGPQVGQYRDANSTNIRLTFAAASSKLHKIKVVKIKPARKA